MPKPRPTLARSLPGSLSSSVLCVFALVLSAAIAGCKGKEPSDVSQGQTTAVRPTPQAFEPAVPIPNKHIYSETADPRADIAAAIRQATAEHKRIILDFGGDWCGDCHVLDLYLHQPPNGDLLARNYILVHVFIGHMDAHMDIPDKYKVPVRKGVPALAVLNSDGKLLFAQQHKEFEKDLNPHDVTAFLNQWKA